MQEWQHMRTAPKDGTHILGFDGVEMVTIRWWRKHWSIIGQTELTDDDGWIPTHWMPLPAKPIVSSAVKAV